MKAASLLRDIIAQEMVEDAKNIILCGTLSLNFAPTLTENINYCNYTSYGVYDFLGFSKEVGFIGLGDCITKKWMSYGNSQSTTEEGLPLIDHPEIEKLSFFIVKSGDDSDMPYSTKIEVYSSPNWAAHKSTLTQEDLKRWEEWYNA